MKQLVSALILITVIIALVYGAPFVLNTLPHIVDAVLGEPGVQSPRDGVREDVVKDEHRQTLPFVLPSGFSISEFANDVPGARVLARDPGGTLVVSLTRRGEVVALPDIDGNGVADRRVRILEGLDRPHGILFRCDTSASVSPEQCFLYVAEEGVVSKYRYNSTDHTAKERRELIDLPTEGGGHFTRTLLAGPGEDQLLVSVGSSCNVCIEQDPRRATIIETDFNGNTPTIFARGLRNAVFMALSPVTGEIWATEMGRDWLGDNTPPDEINIVREGENYGWPICYGDNVHDTDFDKNTYIRNPCQEPFETPSFINLQAHSAPLGLAFVPEEARLPSGQGWPEGMWHDLIVAYHGSWNRTEKTGYKLVRFVLDADGNLAGREEFLTGFLDEKTGDVIGRPVDVLIEPGGVMYVSDDYAGAIYKVVRTET